MKLHYEGCIVYFLNNFILKFIKYIEIKKKNGFVIKTIGVTKCSIFKLHRFEFGARIGLKIKLKIAYDRLKQNS